MFGLFELTKKNLYLANSRDLSLLTYTKKLIQKIKDLHYKSFVYLIFQTKFKLLKTDVKFNKNKINQLTAKSKIYNGKYDIGTN